MQAEALPPDVLAKIVRAAILDVIDEDLWRETLEREERERAGLVERLNALLGGGAA